MWRFPKRTLVALLLAATPATAQDASITIGNALVLDFSAKLQLDWRDLPPGAAAARGGVFDIHRARIGVEGEFLKRIEYQLERNVTDAANPWRDAYINVAALRRLEIKAGRFKMPFSRAQLTPVMQLDFAYRPLAATYLAPGRDVGVMAHGTVRHGLKYQAGFFRRAGDNVRDSERRDPRAAPTVAARVTFEPRQGLTFGGAITAGTVAEGLYSLPGHTVTDDAFFPRLYVNGRRMRTGAEVEWRQGPVSVSGELIRAADERRAQGVDGRDLPDAIAQGWYLSGTWLVTGEKKTDRIRPARRFLKDGAGAVEIVARIERLAMTSRAAGEAPSTSARAGTVAGHSEDVWTTGLNWYLTQWVRVQANVIRERTWTRAIRVQLGI